MSLRKIEEDRALKMQKHHDGTLSESANVESAGNSQILTLTVTRGPIKNQSTAPPCGPGCVLQD